MSNIASISGRPIRNEVNSSVIEDLERLLQLARDGQIIGIMWIGLQPDTCPDCGWSTAPDGFSYAAGIVGLTYKYGQGLWQE